MKHIPIPTPIPIDQVQVIPLYKALPFLQIIPATVWGNALFAIVGIFLQWLYTQFRHSRVLKVENAMNLALGEHQAKIERMLNEKFQKIDDKVTNLMVEVVKNNAHMSDFSSDMQKVLFSIDMHAQKLHKLEMKNIENKR